MLDQWLREKGGIASYDPDIKPTLDDVARAARSSSPFATSDMPPSLAIYPNVDLASHLQQPDQNFARLGNLRIKAATICLEKQVALGANKQLIAEYLQLDVSLRKQGYAKLPLDEKLRVLRTAQQQAREQTEATFNIAVVRGNETNGTPSDLPRLYLPISMSWAGLQQALQETTKGWQAREEGFANGYSMKFGKWLYLISRSGVPDKIPHSLSTEVAYKTMREILDAPNTAVVIWHERLWEASQAARALWADICQEEEARTEDDWVKMNGWQPFHPDLDPDCHPGDDWDIEDGLSAMDARAPSVEPLSDREDHSSTRKLNTTSDQDEQVTRKSRPQTRSHTRKGAGG